MTLTLKVGVRLLRLTRCLIIVNFVAKKFQNSIDEEVMDQKQNIPNKDHVKLWPQCVTLVLMVGVRTCFLVDLVYHIVLRMTRRPIIVNICAKKFQNPLNGEIIMDQIDHVNIPLNVTLKLTEYGSCACHIIALLWTFVQRNVKIL
jgi:hypothetical protein